MAIKAIIFDFDGLILDTETPDYLAWKSVYNKYDVEFPLEAYMDALGRVYQDSGPIKTLIDLASIPLDEQTIKDEFAQNRNELTMNQTLCAGVLDYLQSAKESGLLIGLASSSESEWVVPNLEKYNILNYFDTISTRELVQNPKPDPALYLLAINQLKVKTNEAIALEDSQNGIHAAKAAGLFAVAVPNSVTKIADFSRADLCIDSLADISLKEMIDTLQSN